MAKITGLNNDILLQVFSYIKDDKRTLRRLARIHRKFLPFCREALYRDVSIYTETGSGSVASKPSKLRLLLRSLDQNVLLGPLVRHLFILWSGDSQKTDQHVHDLLSHLTHLQTLNLVTTGITKHKPNYLLLNPLEHLQTFSFTGRMDSEDIAFFMQLESLHSVKILQGSDCPHQESPPESAIVGTSGVTEVTMCSETLFECNLMYILSIPNSLRKLKCSLPFFWNGCENEICSAPPDMPDKLCHAGSDPEIIRPRLPHHLKKVVPMLQELCIDDAHEFFKIPPGRLFIDFSVMEHLRTLSVPSTCFFKSRSSPHSRKGLHGNLPRSLQHFEIRFPLSLKENAGVFCSTWHERKDFEQRGHQNVPESDYQWLLELAQNKKSRFPELGNIKLVEQYEKFKQDNANTDLSVSHLPPEWSRDDLRAIFAPHEVTNSGVFNTTTNISRRYGLIRLSTREVCERVIREFNGKNVLSTNGQMYTLSVHYTDAGIEQSDQNSPVLWKQPHALQYALDVAEIDMEVLLRPFTNFAYHKVQAVVARRRARANRRG